MIELILLIICCDCLIDGYKVYRLQEITKELEERIKKLEDKK